MIPGWVLLGELPLHTLPDDESLATVSVEKLLLADPDADLIFLAEVTPSGGTLLRLSDVGYITGASDTPAHTPYRDRLLNAYNIDTRIPAPGSPSSLGELAFGVVELESGDEVLDALLSESWEGRDLAIKVGGTYHVGLADEGTLTFAQFQVVQRGTVAAVGWAEGRIVLSLRENLQELATPLQTNLYAGTGGLEGGDAIKGQRKPLAYGQVFNLEPVLVDESRRIYQWHDGVVNAVSSGRDRGVALTYAGNVADIEAASPAGGTFVSENARGYLRLGGEPDGRFTIDGQGDKTGGTYVDDAPSIAQRMAERVGLTSDDFEAGSFTGFPETGTVGIAFREEPVTALDAIGQLLAGVFGFVSQSRTGLLRVGRYADPATSVPEVSLTDDLIGAIDEESEVAPAWRVEVEYARNWTLQDADALSDALDAATRELYTKPGRIAADEDASLKTTHPDAQIVRIASHLANQADAEALATEALAILGRRVRTFRLPVERQMFRRHPGAVVRVTSQDSDLGAGRNFLLLSVAEDAASRLNRWELWG